jgi:mannose-6-phosphate isomerase-like protein (cupin superfamily)
MMSGKGAGIVMGAVMAAAAAQAAPADHYTADGLSREMVKLKAEAAATGSASETLARYASHFTMLAYRSKDGAAEVHKQFADMFYIVKGKATLVTEGSIPDIKEESPGEWRGKAVVDGKRVALGEGDVVNIPAGTPHQLLVAPGEELLYFVIKVKEPE